MDVSKIKLLSGRILILPDEPPTESKGGIILPDSTRAAEKPRQGVVKGVAKEPWRYENGTAITTEVKVGDYVLYARYGGLEWKDKDTDVDYLIMTQQDIFAVLPWPARARSPRSCSTSPAPRG